VVAILTRIARSPGWFVPVTPLLDHLAEARGIAELSWGGQAALELRHILDRVRARLPV
jgi:hypothetical protein